MPHVNAELIQGLRALADFLQQHPQPELCYASPIINVFLNAEELPARIRGVGELEKFAAGNYFWLRRSFGPVKLDFSFEREKICRKVSTGTKVVPAVPAQPEKIVETFEWECPDSILRPEPFLAGFENMPEGGEVIPSS